MADYKNLKASDGTGNAVLATITNNRAVSGTILEVTSVENWPNEFIVMTGTLDANGYIEAASATEMKAHLTGTDIEIDSFEPGYTDVGNTSGQVAIIKMTTSWADDITELAQVSHNDDGTLKDNIVTSTKLSTSANLLAITNITSTYNTGNTAATTVLPGTSTTVTVPPGGRSVKVSFNCYDITNNSAPISALTMYIRAAGTNIGGYRWRSWSGGAGTGASFWAIHTPAAGSVTYDLTFAKEVAGHGVALAASATSPIQLLVELV